MIELPIVDAVHLFIVILFALEFIECIPQRISALLIEYPCIFLIDEVVVEFDEMLDSWTIGEFFLGSASKLEEVSAEPDLFYVGLVATLGDYLLYCVFFMTFLMLA
jgi:hypothetical protein